MTSSQPNQPTNPEGDGERASSAGSGSRPEHSSNTRGARPKDAGHPVGTGPSSGPPGPGRPKGGPGDRSGPGRPGGFNGPGGPMQGAGGGPSGRPPGPNGPPNGPPGAGGPPNGPGNGPPPSARSGIALAVYFFRYVRPFLWMVFATVLIGLFTHFLRLPMIFVPMALTSYHENFSGESPSPPGSPSPASEGGQQGNPGQSLDTTEPQAPSSDQQLGDQQLGTSNPPAPSGGAPSASESRGGTPSAEKGGAARIAKKTFAALRERFGQNYLLWYLGICLFFILLSAGSTFLAAYLSALFGERLLRVLRMEIFRKIEDLSMAAIYSSGAGEFVQRLTRDLFYVRDMFTRTLSQILTMSLQVSVNIVVLMTLDWVLTTLLLCLFGVVVPIVRKVNRKVEGLARYMQQLAEQILGQFVESVGGYRDLRASGRFDRITDQFEEQVKRAESASVKTTLWAQSGGVFTHLVVSALLITPYILFVRRIDQVSDPGQVITYVVLFGQVLPVFQQISRLTSDVALATPSMQKVKELLEQQDPARVRATEEAARYVAEQGAEPAVPEAVESIRLEGVTISLANRNVIEEVSFEIPGGRLTAIVGPSGAGKTTIFHLLLRLMEPNQGGISINNIPLSAFPEEALRRIIGFIPQNPFIFNTSIRENLLMALPEGADEQASLDRAIELAQLGPLVASRHAAGGLEAPAGYMGMGLSAGERQRVALARLLLQDPKVIVCDEYTANIDSQTAGLIQQMMDTQLADRTRVMITHELSTIRHADQIVVLDHGRVVQQGTHDQLMASPAGLYHQLVMQQESESVGGHQSRQGPGPGFGGAGGRPRGPNA